MKIISAALLGALVSACQTTGISDKPIMDYPEARAYAVCILSKAESFASQPDSAVDLANIAYAACSSKQYEFEQALLRENRPGFVSAFMRGNRETMVGLAAQKIILVRSHPKR